MSINLKKQRIILNILIVILLATLAIPASAQGTNPPSPEDILRIDMVHIAEVYANHSWTARPENIWHTGVVHTPDAMADYYNDPDHPVPQLPVDPEDEYEWWLDQRHGGWWTIGSNIGVPYYWGGSTAIAGLDLNRDIEASGYFDEALLAGYPAGDVTTEVEPAGFDEDGNRIFRQKVDWNNVNGVDCVGFINNTWRIGVRAGTSATNGGSRPILFRDLRPGDVLLRYVRDGKDHVVLFKEFVNYDPANGEPEEGVTKIRVYEATLGYGRVIV